MINLLWPLSDNYEYKSPVTLMVGEIEEYDFNDCSEQIYYVLSVLQLCGLIRTMPHSSPEDVLEVICSLVDDIDLNSDELQISEYKYIRVEFRDDMLSLEVFVGV